MIVIEKNLIISILFDFYGNMLTNKQKDAIDLYYNKDLSLEEISQHAEITRQGVRDNIKRGEKILTDLEDKLKLVEKYYGMVNVLKKIEEYTSIIKTENEKMVSSDAIKKSTNEINKIINEIIKEM